MIALPTLEDDGHGKVDEGERGDRARYFDRLGRRAVTEFHARDGLFDPLHFGDVRRVQNPRRKDRVGGGLKVDADLLEAAEELALHSRTLGAVRGKDVERIDHAAQFTSLLLDLRPLLAQVIARRDFARRGFAEILRLTALQGCDARADFRDLLFRQAAGFKLGGLLGAREGQRQC